MQGLLTLAKLCKIGRLVDEGESGGRGTAPGIVISDIKKRENLIKAALRFYIRLRLHWSYSKYGSVVTQLTPRKAQGLPEDWRLDGQPANGGELRKEADVAWEGKV